MKRIFVMMVAVSLVMVLSVTVVSAETDSGTDEFVDIPDTNLRTYLTSNNNIDTYDDDQISYTEAASYTGRLRLSNKDISQLDGLGAFISVTNMDLRENPFTDTSPIDGMEALTILKIGDPDVVITDYSGLINKPNLEELTFEGSATDGFKCIKDSDSIIELVIRYATVEAADFEWIAQGTLASTLLRLHIEESPGYSNDDLKNLQGMNVLQELAVQDCGLTSLSFMKDTTAEPGFVSLATLLVNGNDLVDIDDANYASSLTYINAYDNEIQQIGNLTGLGQLTQLDISSNDIYDIRGLSYLGNLEQLEAEDNDIRDLDPLRYLSNLEELYLSDNDISNIEPLVGLESTLVELYLSGNELWDASTTYEGILDVSDASAVKAGEFTVDGDEYQAYVVEEILEYIEELDGLSSIAHADFYNDIYGNFDKAGRDTYADLYQMSILTDAMADQSDELAGSVVGNISESEYSELVSYARSFSEAEFTEMQKIFDAYSGFLGYFDFTLAQN